MKVRIEIHGQVLEGELEDESVNLTVRRDVEKVNGEHRLLKGGSFSLTGLYTERMLWSDA